MAQGMQDLVTLSQAMSSFAQSVNTLHRAKVEAETGKYLIQRSRAQAEFLNRMNKMEINDDNWETEFSAFRDQMSSQIDSIKDEKVRYGVAKQVVPLDDEFMVQLSNKYAEQQVRSINLAYSDTLGEITSSRLESDEETDSAFTSGMAIIDKMLLSSPERKTLQMNLEKWARADKLARSASIEKYTTTEETWAGSAPVQTGEAEVEKQVNVPFWVAKSRLYSDKYKDEDQRVIQMAADKLQAKQDEYDANMESGVGGIIANASMYDTSYLLGVEDQIANSGMTPDKANILAGKVGSEVDKRLSKDIVDMVSRSLPAIDFSSRTVDETLESLKVAVVRMGGGRNGTADEVEQQLKRIDAWREQMKSDSGIAERQRVAKDCWATLKEEMRNGTKTFRDGMNFIFNQQNFGLGLRDEWLDDLTRSANGEAPILSGNVNAFFRRSTTDAGVQGLLDQVLSNKGSVAKGISDLDKEERSRAVADAMSATVEMGIMNPSMSQNDLYMDFEKRLVALVAAQSFYGQSLVEGGKKAIDKAYELIRMDDRGQYGALSVINRHGREVGFTGLALSEAQAKEVSAQYYKNIISDDAMLKKAGISSISGSPTPVVGETPWDIQYHNVEVTTTDGKKRKVDLTLDAHSREDYPVFTMWENGKVVGVLGERQPMPKGGGGSGTITTAGRPEGRTKKEGVDYGYTSKRGMKTFWILVNGSKKEVGEAEYKKFVASKD